MKKSWKKFKTSLNSIGEFLYDYFQALFWVLTYPWHDVILLFKEDKIMAERKCTYCGNTPCTCFDSINEMDHSSTIDIQKVDEIEPILSGMRHAGISIDAWIDPGDDCIWFEIDGILYTVPNDEKGQEYIKSLDWIDEYGKKE